MIYIILLIICLVAFCGVILSSYSYKHLKEEYENLCCKYENTKKNTIEFKKQEELHNKEIERLKAEIEILKNEKKVARKNTIKTVEDLPKTEKITKKRTTKK